MRTLKEETGRIVFNEKEYFEGQLVGNNGEGGIFIIISIERQYVEEEDKEEVFKGYEIGQELDPKFICKKIYVGSSFSELKKPKDCIISANLLTSAMDILNNREFVLNEQLSNVNDIKDIIKD